MTKLAAILCLVAVAAAPAAADDDVPRSLRMRRPTPAPVPAKPDDPAPVDEPLTRLGDDGKVEVISVSDDATARNLVTGATPVSVVTRADIEATGRSTLGDILQALPGQGNAGNAQDNVTGDGATRINLRGLGAARTLVLINGRRVMNGGAGADSSADLNAIPLALIERVEVLKDGASALYGADAVGGVVNVVTRLQFQGVDATLLTGTSQRGDANEYDASLVTGFTTKDRNTYFVGSAGFQGHGSVFAGDRDFSTVQKTYDFASRTERRFSSLAPPAGRLDVSSIGIAGVPTGAMPPGCSAGSCKREGDGTWSNFTPPGDSYNEAPSNYLYTPSRRFNLFGTAGNRVNDHVALIIELLYMRRTSDRELSPVAFEADAPISKDSLYNPFGADILDFRRRITELGPRHFEDDANLLRFVVGAKGKIAETSSVLPRWAWEISFNHGDSTARAKTTGQLDRPHIADAIGPSMLDERGVPICVRTPGDASTKIEYPDPPHPVPLPCIPIDLMSPAGTIAKDQFERVAYTDVGAGTDGVRTLLATASGDVMRLPHHGAITLALGGDYRSEIATQAPPSIAAAGESTDTIAESTEGTFGVYEGYGQLSIVPIANHPIARWVELVLGARALHDSRFGAQATYKASGLFRTVHGLSARATYATAFRAPSLRDTLGGLVERLPAAEDPCDTRPPSVGEGERTLADNVQAQCTAQRVPVGSAFQTNQQRSAVGGNPDLTPEHARSGTIGIVYEPPQLPGLAASLDYWRISIHDAIETLGAQTILANCYDRGLASFCDQVRRDPVTHRITRINQALQNVNRTTTSGVDLTVWFDTKLATYGSLHTALEGQYLLSYDLDTSLQTLHGVGNYDLGVYPHVKANLSGQWTHPGGAQAGATVRFVGGYEECAANNCNNPDNASRDVARYFKLDLFGGYDLRSRIGKTAVQVGINNVLDATPPLVYNALASNSDATTYDFIGRMVYLRLSQQF